MYAVSKGEPSPRGKESRRYGALVYRRLGSPEDIQHYALGTGRGDDRGNGLRRLVHLAVRVDDEHDVDARGQPRGHAGEGQMVDHGGIHPRQFRPGLVPVRRDYGTLGRIVPIDEVGLERVQPGLERRDEHAVVIEIFPERAHALYDCCTSICVGRLRTFD